MLAVCEVRMKNNGMSILLIGLALVLLAGSVLLYHNVSERVPDYIPVSTPSPQYDRTEPAPASPKPASPSPSPAPTQSPFPRATDFSYTDSDGNSYQLSDLYGKPCILNFFATWCPPCRAEYRRARINAPRTHKYLYDYITSVLKKHGLRATLHVILL